MRRQSLISTGVFLVAVTLTVSCELAMAKDETASQLIETSVLESTVCNSAQMTKLEAGHAKFLERIRNLDDDPAAEDRLDQDIYDFLKQNIKSIDILLEAKKSLRTNIIKSGRDIDTASYLWKIIQMNLEAADVQIALAEQIRSALNDFADARSANAKLTRQWGDDSSLSFKVLYGKHYSPDDTWKTSWDGGPLSPRIGVTGISQEKHTADYFRSLYCGSKRQAGQRTEHYEKLLVEEILSRGGWGRLADHFALGELPLLSRNVYHVNFEEKVPGWFDFWSKASIRFDAEEKVVTAVEIRRRSGGLLGGYPLPRGGGWGKSEPGDNLEAPMFEQLRQDILAADALH